MFLLLPAPVWGCCDLLWRKLFGSKLKCKSHWPSSIQRAQLYLSLSALSPLPFLHCLDYSACSSRRFNGFECVGGKREVILAIRWMAILKRSPCSVCYTVAGSFYSEKRIKQQSFPGKDWLLLFCSFYFLSRSIEKYYKYLVPGDQFCYVERTNATDN